MECTEENNYRNLPDLSASNGPGSGGQLRVGMAMPEDESSRSGSRMSIPLTARAADVARRIISRRLTLREVIRSVGSSLDWMDVRTSTALVTALMVSRVEPRP